MTIARTGVLLAALVLSACSQQQTPAAQEAEAKPAVATPALNAAQTDYAAANARMHAGMAAIPADADKAFVVGMIAHHQGAIDMANVVLKHGKDPRNKALAESIITAQEAEIAQMKAWLAERGTDGDAAAIPEMDHEAMGH